MPARNRWVEHATATNATATATRSAETGRTHHVTRLVASFSGSSSANLSLDFGGTTVFSVDIETHVELELDNLPAAAGEKVDAVLGAGGSGIDGHVNIIGYTA